MRTKIANEILERLAKTHLAAYESRVLWAVIYKSGGQHEEGTWITHSQLAALTKLDVRNALKALRRLVKRNIITCQPVGKHKEYGINTSIDLWLE